MRAVLGAACLVAAVFLFLGDGAPRRAFAPAPLSAAGPTPADRAIAARLQAYDAHLAEQSRGPLADIRPLLRGPAPGAVQAEQSWYVMPQAETQAPEAGVPAAVYAACGAAVAFAVAASRGARPRRVARANARAGRGPYMHHGEIEEHYGDLEATPKTTPPTPPRSPRAGPAGATMQASAEVPMGEAPKGFENELGATAPLGFWDPLGLSTRASPETFRRWRATELKHGRIAMMATVGYIVQEFMRWPGYLSTSAGVKFEDLPNGIGAWAAMPDAGKFQVVFGILLMEGVTWPYYDGGGPLWAPGRKVKEGKEPGDVAGDVWVRYTDPEVRANKLNIELNNGRAAMLGITGMLMHDHITGSWIPPGL